MGTEYYLAHRKLFFLIREGNKTFNEQQSIANHFNDYFSNIGPNLAKIIPVVEKPFHSFF